MRASGLLRMYPIALVQRFPNSVKIGRRESITRLAAEVKEALDADTLYGPKHDRWRHTIGVEYEVLLEDMLQSMGRCTDISRRHLRRTNSLKDSICLGIGIPFETESDLRDKGSSKTPDVLLQCPIGVQVGEEWRVVNWIDSKVRAEKVH